MEAKQEFVGSVRMNASMQELVKSCSGGMIAVSSGILLFWMQSEKAITPFVLLMLAAHAFGIPILVTARVFYAIFNRYERISIKANEELTNLFAVGIAFATIGYFFSIFQYSIILAIIFGCGVMIAFYCITKLFKEVESAHMKIKS